MNRAFLSIFIIFFAFQTVSVRGQTAVDTIGSTGIMSDTAYAYRCLKEALVYLKKRQWPEVLIRLDTAERIYVAVLGNECAGYGTVLHAKGLVYRNMNQLDTSTQLYEKAILVRTKALGSYHKDLANSYNNAGNAYRANGLADKSIDRHKKALEIRQHLFGESNEDVAVSYYSIGLAYYDKEDYEKALEFHQKALEIRLHLPKVNPVDLANSYNDIGFTLSGMRRFEEAQASMENALSKRIEAYGPDHAEVASVYNNMGGIRFYAGDYAAGLDLFRKVLDMRIRILGENDLKVAEGYENIGLALKKMGRYREALPNYENSKSIFLNNFGPDHPRVAQSFLQMTSILMPLQDYEKALNYGFEALRINLKTFGEDSRIVANCYNNLGVIYLQKGDYKKAVSYHLQDLAISLRLLGEDHIDVAEIYTNLGIAARKEQDFDQSLRYNQQALDIRLKLLGEDHLKVAESYNNMANVYSDIGQYDKAIDYHKKSLVVHRKALGETHPSVAQVYNNLANPYLQKGEFEKSIEMCRKALLSVGYAQFDSLNKASDLEQMNKALFLLSKTNLAQYKSIGSAICLDRSVDGAQQCLKGVEFQLLSISADGDKTYLKERDREAYELPLKIYFAAGLPKTFGRLTELVFSGFEKSKSGLLQAQIQETNAFHFANIADSLLQKEQFLRYEITRREKQQQGLIYAGSIETDTNLLRVNTLLLDLRTRYTNLTLQFETNYPTYYRLKYDLSTVSLPYVQDTLLTKNQSLLEYFVGDSSIYLFVVRPDTFIIKEVKRDFPLDDWIEQFRQGLYGFHGAEKNLKHDTLYARTLRQYLEFGPKLYQKLIAPVAQYLTEQVVLVPDGPLGYLPFNALLSSPPKDRNNFKTYPYLLNKYQFSYTYSATLLRDMRDKKHHHPASKELAAFAPFYTGDTLVFKDSYGYVSRNGFDPLPFTKAEVGEARKAMGGDIISGPAATEERFTSIAGNYRILHLATHGRADNRVGDYAYLAFSEIKDSLENELLYVKDLYNLELNADLVVLSACETGIGKLQRGEGIISLARAFAYAGAKSIVTTLWSVNDQSTAELMRYFYRELKKGETKDAALRAAQLEYISKNAKHPYFWAAFIPIGDMRAVK